ncbi:uncharacterized protein EDB93DRAFT_1327322 [Suillus bovinus]|uniref:uncharacterized protein n=1 Tax=Suillus bovinus TaxID=48563 RepID=UPI001B872D66|nr:uncharacterized protein EDB93DRAFT_1327322 [Suillus bovinus]KAG2153500.1 hypothetical protein EDB93DRAFT_1327322 [Suillus bovinus]
MVLSSRSSRTVPFWFGLAKPFQTIIDFNFDCDCDKVGLHIKLLSSGFALLVNQATFSLFKAPLICVPPIIQTEPSLSSILPLSTHKLQLLLPINPAYSHPSTPQITTTTAPTTSSTPSIPDFFAKPIAPSTPAPAAPSFSFGPMPAQPLFAAPTSTSTNPFSAPAASSTETGKPAPFPFAKPTHTTSSNAAPTSAPSTPAPLKFDFGKKPASTIPKPTAAPSPTTTVADTAK